MRRLLRCLDTHFGLYVEYAHKLLHMQQFLRADGRPLRGDTLQQLAQLFQNILAGDPFALEDGLRLRHLLPGGDISATGCGGLLHGKSIPALFHSKRAFRPRPVNWRARHGFRRSRQERRHPRVLEQQTFRDQASLMNALLWQQVIPKSCDLPPLVSLDMQWLCGRLITADLEQPDSLVRHLLLHPPLAAAIWDALNGQRACWTGDAQGLQRGTFLFWGVDGKGRALALRPARDFRSLVAVRDAGWRLPLDARTLGRALTEERILPSLFLYFATVTAARGLRCAGGIFQTSYLPRMIRGICTALRHCGANGPATRIAGAFRPCPPCTGLLPLRLPCPDGPLRQTGRGAGAADLWLAGGLSPALWQSLRHSRVDHALAASLPYHYEDLSAQEMRPPLLDSLLQQAPPIGSLPFLAPSPLEMPHA